MEMVTWERLHASGLLVAILVEVSRVSIGSVFCFVDGIRVIRWVLSLTLVF
jgi:hypothetical protein